MVQKVPSCRIVSILFFSQALDFSRLKHLVQSIVVGVLIAVIVGHLKHAREGSVRVKNLIAAHECKSLRESFEDLKPAIKRLL